MKISRPLAGGLFCLIALLLCQYGFAKEQSGPINIEADRMESKQGENIVLFSGNVEARQDSFTILADRMTVYYSADAPKNAAGVQAVQRIVSEGNVRMKRQDWSASSDRMEYFEKDRKVVLLGNAKVLQNNNMVTGGRVEMFLDEGRSVVEKGEGNNERVTVTFNPDSTASAPAKQKGKADGPAAGR